MSEASTTSTNETKSVRGLTNILDALLAKGLLNEEQVQSIKFESINGGKLIDDILYEKNIVSSEQVARIYAEMRNVAFINLSDIFIPLETLNLIPANLARDNMAIAFEDMKVKLKVAMEDPLDLQKVKYLESLTKKSIETYYASREDIVSIIETKYGAQIGQEVDEAMEEVSSLDLTKESQTAFTGSSEEVGAAPIIKIINMILEYGIKNDASDIHIEPRDTNITVRFRIRGVLHEKLTIPRKLLSALVTRIKILSNLKIDEHRIPQDSRFQVKSEGKGYTDVRVSIMPSIHGEKIVLRLQGTSKGIMDLADIGIRGISYSRLKSALTKTQGIILVTGPTGSGKTQTLASSLKMLNTAKVNIITLEDPVEIKVSGVNQVQVNPEVGLTFASGLRSILRQDPDIIMVGEIRDSETAGLAVQAALVGRLVLATLHTNSAAGAFIRLIDMGIEPFLLASTVNIVEAQRLVRVLCEDCKQKYEADSNVVEQLHKELDSLNGFNVYDENKRVKLHFDANTKNIVLYKAVGCPKCNQTGYVSRTGIFECLHMSEKISSFVLQKASIRDIHNTAVAEGMVTMIQDGFIKTLEGVTTMEEVLRVRNE